MPLKLQEGQEKLIEEPAQTPLISTRGSGTETIEQQPIASEILEYILTLTSDLKAMAQNSGHHRLSLILMLAEDEARRKLCTHR